MCRSIQELQEGQQSLEVFVVEKLKQIMKERNISRYKLSKLTDINQTTIVTILEGKGAPSMYTIERLCLGLGVSVKDFFKKQDENTLLASEEQKRAFRYFHELNQKQKARLLEYVKGLIAENC